MMKKAVLTLLCSLSVVFLACDAGSPPGEDVSVRDSAGVRIVENRRPAWGTGEGWRLADSPSVVIGVTDRGEGPLDPKSVFRTSDGEIVIADGGQFGDHRVLVYDQEGRLQRGMGRKGEGPCEFQQLWWAAPYRGDSIAAYDQARHAVTFFGPGGECGRTTGLPQGTSQRRMMMWGAVGPYPDGSILAHPVGYPNIPSRPGPVWYLHSLLRAGDGGVRDTLGHFRAFQVYWTGEHLDELAFARRAVATLDGFDLLYGDATDFEFRRIDTAGVLKRIVRRAFEPVPTTGDELADYPFADYADTKPAYSGLLADASGHVWVQDFTLLGPFLPPNPPPEPLVHLRAGRQMAGTSGSARRTASDERL